MCHWTNERPGKPYPCGEIEPHLAAVGAGTSESARIARAVADSLAPAQARGIAQYKVILAAIAPFSDQQRVRTSEFC